MMRCFFAIFFLAGILPIQAQIVVGLETLPDVGDVLAYKTFVTSFDDQIEATGANLEWDFRDFPQGTDFDETYQAATEGTDADLFPDADLLINFFGMTAYGKRNTTNISLLGTSGDAAINLGIPIQTQFDNPFVIRRAPLGFGDEYEDEGSFQQSFAAADIPVLGGFVDSLNRIPGTEVDSIRINFNFNRVERADAWGICQLPMGEIEVLKVTQEDTRTYSLEVHTTSILGSNWINISDFIPDGIGDFSTQQSTTYKFLSASDKESIVEFTVNDGVFTTVTGQYKRDLVNNTILLDEVEKIQIFPNPVHDELVIEQEIANDEQILEIWDWTGKLLLKQGITTPQTRLQVSNWMSGTYLLQIRTPTAILVQEHIVIIR